MSRCRVVAVALVKEGPVYDRAGSVLCQDLGSNF